MKSDEMVKTLRWIASNDEICFNAEQANNAAELIEQQKEIEQLKADRDQWKQVAEASRDVIQPKLRAEIEELKAKQAVRCGECKFWEEQFDTVGICKYGNINLDHCNNGYCSYGERKGEEE